MITATDIFKEAANYLGPELICEQCGEELEHGGILEWSEHFSVCKKNAPNSSILMHRLKVEAEEWRREYEKRRRAEEKVLNRIYPKMTMEERTELFALNVNGIWDGEMVLMGAEAYRKFDEYKKKMIEKYGK